MKPYKILFILLIVVFLISCSSTPAPTKAEVYKGMYDEQPKVLLIMPPINTTTQVSAKDTFYTVLHEPLTEAGYYVLPPILSMTILQQESGYDAERFLNDDISVFRDYFGADAVVFTMINRWDKSMLTGQVVLDITYLIRSTKTGNELYRKNIVYHLKFNNSKISTGNSWIDLATNLSLSAISSLATDNVIISMQCTDYALTDLPFGPYHPSYMVDGEIGAAPKDEYYM